MITFPFKYHSASFQAFAVKAPADTLFRVQLQCKLQGDGAWIPSSSLSFQSGAAGRWGNSSLSKRAKILVFWKPQEAAFLPGTVEEASGWVKLIHFSHVLNIGVDSQFLFTTPSLISSHGEWDRSSSFTLQWLTSEPQGRTYQTLHESLCGDKNATLLAPGCFGNAPISRYTLCYEPPFSADVFVGSCRFQTL